MFERMIPFSKIPAASLSLALALAVGAHAGPSGWLQDYLAPTASQAPFFESHIDLDFSKASASFPARNFPTWSNPSNTPQTVKYFSQMLNSDLSGGTCYEISTISAAGTDPVIFSRNAASVWVGLADDNAGSNQFRARVFATQRSQNELRVSPYFAANNNDNVTLVIKKIKANGGSAINANSCRLSGVPFYQFDQNGGNPLL